MNKLKTTNTYIKHYRTLRNRIHFYNLNNDIYIAISKTCQYRCSIFIWVIWRKKTSWNWLYFIAVLWYYYDRFGYTRKTSLNMTKGWLEFVHRKARPYNGQTKRRKRQAMIYNKLHRIKTFIYKNPKTGATETPLFIDMDKRN
jgi:hypothetical protein